MLATSVLCDVSIRRPMRRFANAQAVRFTNGGAKQRAADGLYRNGEIVMDISIKYCVQ